jgi:hypothetical protein
MGVLPDFHANERVSIALASLPCDIQSLVFYGIANNIIGTMFMPPRMVHLLSKGAGQVLALFLCSLKIAPLTGVSIALAPYLSGRKQTDAPIIRKTGTPAEAPHIEVGRNSMPGCR